MGAANVIPGVSGGTIAFVTGIYDDLIASLKAFDLKAIKLLFTGKFKEFFDHINFSFLIVLFAGIGIGLVSFGKVLKWAVNYESHVYEIFVWAFFFGLILASVFSVGKTIKQWSIGVIIATLCGVVVAVSLVFVGQASENAAMWYLLLCGAIAMASMLLPGLSGSFVLMLMGNYYLIMLEAVPNWDIKILAFVGIGAVVGFVVLSRVISYLLGKFEKVTIGTLTGFIFGSLVTIWPWKTVLRETLVGSTGKEKEVISGFSNWRFPNFETQDWFLIVTILAGALLVVLVEYFGNKFGKESST